MKSLVNKCIMPAAQKRSKIKLSDEFHIRLKIVGMELKLVQKYLSDTYIFGSICSRVCHEHSHFMRTTRLQNAVTDVVSFSYTETSVLGGPFQVAVRYNAV